MTIPSPHSKDNRAQVLIVAAAVIFVTVIVFVGLLNTAAFTQAERETGVQTQDRSAQQTVEEVRNNLETTVEAININSGEELQDIFPNQLDEAIELHLNESEQHLQHRFAERRSTVEIETEPDEDDVTFGKRFSTSSPGPLADGNDTQNLLGGPDGVRKLGIEINDEEELPNTESEAVRFNISENGGGSNTVRIWYEDADREVVFKHEDGPRNESSASEPIGIDLLDFTMLSWDENGEKISPLQVTPNQTPDPHEINQVKIENGADIDATMVAVANMDSDDGSTPDVVEEQTAIYSMDLTVAVSDNDQYIETGITIIPGIDPQS